MIDKGELINRLKKSIEEIDKELEINHRFSGGNLGADTERIEIENRKTSFMTLLYLVENNESNKN
jgi:hypothetical protein